ncbi:MAG TPA: choice-of-anchor tandem repeat GloVer-containing protein [Rhodanobacteraceae bacterium]|nr:choice-of-anchor tandem repeat GloVer-containing protein [Rhodanobacteraceae bacterium]
MRSDRATSLFRGALWVFVIALAAFAACAQAQTYDLRVIHRFTGAPNDGDEPEAGVQFDGAGNLYGTTVSGGAYNYFGTIFKITPDGTETILYSFEDAADGGYPGPVTVDPATGDVYGSSYIFLIDGQPECGQIYKLAANGAFTLLHVFTCGSGTGAISQLLRDLQGNLYGTEEYGGSIDGYGAIFKIGADGSFTVLHTFNGTDGADVVGGVVRDRAGNLYGVTRTGTTEATGGGTIYKLAPNGTLTTLHAFTGGADGSQPSSLVRDQAGNLYGTDEVGDQALGMVFKLAPDGTFSTLYTFTANQGLPIYPLLSIAGNLYGVTSSGGDSGYGTLFRVTADGTYTMLHSFTLRDGIYPFGKLTLKYGRLFGTTACSSPNHPRMRAGAPCTVSAQSGTRCFALRAPSCRRHAEHRFQ